MATARPPGGQTAGGPQARIGIDLSAMRAAPAVAREAGQATAREISQAFRTLQNEQRLALEQARQTTVVLRAQQTQISASTRAESQVRIQQARAESVAQQQAARTASQVAIQEERRKTTAFNAEIRQRNATQRGMGQGVSQFAGAALGGIGGPVGAIAGGLAGGALPIAAGLAVSQGARAAVDASNLAVAYNRQRVAAENLAGGTGRLNGLLAAYTRASGGAVDRTSALANVTRLMAVGFGNSEAEVTRFTTAVRGSSIAMGVAQDQMSQEVQLAISNQSLRRLDQIGLGIAEVNNRIAELRASSAGMTREAAFQEAILGLLNEKFGALAKSAEGAATGIEKVGVAAKDARLEIGQIVSAPVNLGGNLLAAWIMAQTESLRGMERAAQDLTAALQRLAGVSVPTGMQQRFIASSAGRDAARHPGRGRGGASGPSFDDDQTAALRRREEGFTEIERDARVERLEQTRAYLRQQASLVSNYEKSVLREQEDFGRQRANAERKLQLSILDVAQDSARQRVKWAADLERTIGQARADSAERVSQMVADHEEKLAEARADSAARNAEQRAATQERIEEARAQSSKRITELEADQLRERERAQRDHRRTLLSAVAQLDAYAIFQEQQRFADEAEERAKANQEAIAKERARLTESISEQDAAGRKAATQEAANLQKRIDAENKAHDKRLTQEAHALDKSITQQQEAHALRLAEQAENDALRIDDMRRAFDDQKQQEDIERGIRLGRQAADHQAQLEELAAAHVERIEQIKTEEAEKRAQFTEESNAFLEAVGIHNQAWLDEQERLNAGVLKRHQELLDAERRALELRSQPYVDRANPGLYTPPPLAAPGGGGTTNSSTSSVVVSPGAIQIFPTGNQSPYDIANEVSKQMELLLNNAAGRYQQR